MKRFITMCLAMLCISLSLGFTSCNEDQLAEMFSDDLSSLMFSLEDVEYTLPVHFSELEANGWRICDIENDYDFATYTLEPNEHKDLNLINGDRDVGVTFTNFSETTLPISESYITQIVTHHRFWNAQIILPGNIMLGSTFEDVIMAYGEPSMQHTFDATSSLIFYSSDYFILQMTINLESNRITVMGLHYLSD